MAPDRPPPAPNQGRRGPRGPWPPDPRRADGLGRVGEQGIFGMDEQTKTEIWDLAAGTFIAVSVVSSLAYMIVSAI